MKHIAFKYSFEELWRGLMDGVSKGYIQRKDKKFNSNNDTDVVLSLFNYTPKCTGDRIWNDFTLSARGLILCEKEMRIIALPFPKFFNYGEMGQELPNEDFSILEKIDGSLGIIFFYNGWHVATRGSFDSEQARWAEAWMFKNINVISMDHTWTYLSEIVYNENRIVVKNDFEGLVLLSGFSIYGGEEITISQLCWHNEKNWIYPHTYIYTINDLLKIAKELGADTEGFVVRFRSGLRIKIKGDEYCRIHRLISECTPLGVWRVLMACDDLQMIRQKLPEEYLKDFDTLVYILKNKFNVILKNIMVGYDQHKELTDKELGLLIKSKPALFTEEERCFLFTFRKNNALEMVKEKGMLRDKIFRLFRPDGNRLDGYTPTTLLNRFAEEL